MSKFCIVPVVFSNLCATPTPAMLVRHDRVQYREKERKSVLAPRETKDMAYKTLARPKLEYLSSVWNPYSKSQVYQLEKVQRTAARWTCKRWRNTSHVSDMLNELDWPTLEDRREQASLAFFHKIHSGNVAIERNKYLTPVPRLRQTRAFS